MYVVVSSVKTMKIDTYILWLYVLTLPTKYEAISMEKFIIHIGYPKTATTSIQNGWLYQLHQDELINYFGKFRVEGSEYEKYSMELYYDMLREEVDPFEKMDFSSDVPNIVSHEVLTKPLLFKKRRHDVQSLDYSKSAEMEPFEIPKVLGKMFEDISDEITIWVTLRNQQELINSLYANYYQYFEADPELNQWDQYLHRVMEENPPTIYDFDQIIDAYRQEFGRENIRVLFFEEFINNRDIFAESLRKMLQISEEDFYESVNINKHDNKKKQTTDGYFRDGTNTTGRLLKRTLRRAGLFNTVKYGLIRTLGRNRYGDLIHERFMDEVQIKKPTQGQKEQMLERFSDSNKNLHMDFDIPKQKLEKYEYIR